MQNTVTRCRLELEQLEAKESPTSLNFVLDSLEVARPEENGTVLSHSMVFRDLGKLDDPLGWLDPLTRSRPNGIKQSSPDRFDSLRPMPAPAVVPNAAGLVDRGSQPPWSPLAERHAANQNTYGPAPQDIRTLKKNVLNSRIGLDVTGSNASITWHDEGISTDPVQCNNTLNNPFPISFNLGMGQASTVTNTLCSQQTQNSWNVRGAFIGGETVFQLITQMGRGFTQAGATRTVPGSVAAATTFKVADFFTARPIPATVTAAGMKDDASVQSDAGSSLQSIGGLEFDQNGTAALSVRATMGARNGASATLDKNGLILLAQPGQTVNFGVVFSDSITASQSFQWSVSFDGTTLSVTATGVDIDASFFTQIAGGYSLAYNSMPGVDVTESLSGQIGFGGFAQVGPSPP